MMHHPSHWTRYRRRMIRRYMGGHMDNVLCLALIAVVAAGTLAADHIICTAMRREAMEQQQRL